MADYNIGISDEHINLRRPGVDPDEAERSPGVDDDHADFVRCIDVSGETGDTRIDEEVKFADDDRDESAHHNDASYIGCGAPET